MIAFAEDQRFAKIIDYHSSGRECLYGYRQGAGCPTYVMQNYIRNEAIALSQASSYNGQVRGPSSNGEHYEWALGVYSNSTFLTEISNTQSPSQTSAYQEAARVWPGTVWFLQRPIPVSGHITDANTGLPIVANIEYLEFPFGNGEQNRSEPLYGRYHAFVPNGTVTLRFTHPCYETKDVVVNVTSAGAVAEVQLDPQCAGCAERNGSNVNPTGFDCVTTPLLGTNWDTTVATTANTLSTLMILGSTPGQLNLGTPGELLVGLNPQPVALIGNGSHSVFIPNDPFFIGIKLCTQGARVDNPGGLLMMNAQDVTLGTPVP